MKKTTSRYVITTSALNSYLYRVLTSGVDYSQYLNNPVLFWMHKKDTSFGQYDKTLPLGRAVELQVNGDAISCRLEFSESNPFAMMVYNMYEDGSLNMLSLGALPIEMSDAPALMVPGQVGPTITKCKVIEVSCVDVGGNDEALGLPLQLYDNGGKMISLSLSNTTTLMQMAKKAQPDNINTSIEHTPKTLAIVDNAVKVGKLKPDFAKTLLNLGNDDTSINIIKQAVKSAKIDPSKFDGAIHSSLMPLLNKSWYDLENNGAGLKTLKQHVPEVYKAKFFEKHDRMPAERDGKPL